MVATRSPADSPSVLDLKTLLGGTALALTAAAGILLAAWNHAGSEAPSSPRRTAAVVHVLLPPAPLPLRAPVLVASGLDARPAAAPPARTLPAPKPALKPAPKPAAASPAEVPPVQARPPHRLPAFLTVPGAGEDVASSATATQITGPARRVGPDWIEVGTRHVALYGVVVDVKRRCGSMTCGAAAERLLAARFHASRRVTCQLPLDAERPGRRAPSSTGMTCLDPEGVDLSGLLVSAGVATPAPGVADYVGAAEVARTLNGDE